MFPTLWWGDLLARHPRNESSPSDLTACFQPPVHRRQLAPGCGIGLAVTQTPEDDAVSGEKTSRLCFNRCFPARGAEVNGDWEPSSSAVMTSIPRRAQTQGLHDAPNAGKSVRSDEAAGCEAGDSGTNRRLVASARSYELLKE